MLENERLISKMTLEQKLNLVTSSKLFRSSPVGKYEFPVVRFRKRPFQGSRDAVLTQFPSDRTLASSWNLNLVRKVFCAAGEEARYFNAFDGYYSFNDPKKQGVSASHHLTATYLAAKHAGLSGNQPTAHQLTGASFTEKVLRRNFTDTLLEEGEPDVLVAETAEEAEFYLKNENYHGLVYGIATLPEEVARFFFVGCTFVFLREDISKDIVSYFDSRTKEYKETFDKYNEKKVKLKDLDRLSCELKIFDEGLIDRACDRFISYLKKQKEKEVKGGADQQEENAKKKRECYARHLPLAREAARESVVLLKNDGVLPFRSGANVALIGEYASNFDFQRETFACSPTQTRTPLDVVRDFEDMNVLGYADGYRKGEGANEELITNAARLASSADCSLVFLTANPADNTIPENQQLLIKALLSWKLKIVAVVAAERCPDMGFAKGCNAILFTGRGGQEAASAVFDLVTGADSPSGKLTEEVTGSVSYPLGYGLSYTNFEYKDLKIDENGASCLVENKGEYDGYATVQLYVQMEGSQYVEKTLKGFAKEFVKKGDSVRITIPFTENTFRYFDEERSKYRVKGGEYKVYLSENRTSDKLTGTVKVASNEGNVFKNTVTASSAKGDKVAFSGKKATGEKQGMPFRLKIYLLASLFVIFTAAMLLVMLAPFIPIDKDAVFYAATASALLVVDALTIFFIVFFLLKHRAKAKEGQRDELLDMVDNVEDFVEIAKLTYRDPVKEKKEAEKKAKAEEIRQAKEEAEKAAKEKEEKEKVEKSKAEKEKKVQEGEGAVKKEPSLDSPEDYPFADSFEAVCTSFRKYLLNSGINIENSSARSFLAAMAATRFVLVSSKNNELLPEFEKAVNGYFNGSGICRAESNWNTVEDLLWREENGKSDYSDFTNAVIDASKRRNKNAVAIIDNVDCANLSDWFSDFIEFALAPSEKRSIGLHADTKLTLPQNLCYLLFLREDGLRTELSEKAANASVRIEVSIRRAEATAGESDAKKSGSISYPNFNVLVREARDEYFLSEKNWSKIDQLFELVNAAERMSFGNKNTLQAERFTSVVMSCGGEESEALESLLLCKVVPYLKTGKLYAREDGIGLLSDYFQKVFSDLDLSRVKRALSDRSEKPKTQAQNPVHTTDPVHEPEKPVQEPEKPVHTSENVHANAESAPAGANAESKSETGEKREAPKPESSDAPTGFVFGGAADVKAANGGAEETGSAGEDTNE